MYTIRQNNDRRLDYMTRSAQRKKIKAYFGEKFIRFLPPVDGDKRYISYLIRV